MELASAVDRPVQSVTLAAAAATAAATIEHYRIQNARLGIYLFSKLPCTSDPKLWLLLESWQLYPHACL